ncbi:hypothetical protein Tco_1160705 [Tanacetum coccineum]
MMSSPNHPTFDIDDAFSFNFPDYTSTSPDYFPVSPGNISPDPLDNLSNHEQKDLEPETLLHSFNLAPSIQTASYPSISSIGSCATFLNQSQHRGLPAWTWRVSKVSAKSSRST